MTQKTICGTEIDKYGNLVTTKGITKEIPILFSYKGKILNFCEEICKIQFIEAKDKEIWIENHK